MSRQQTPDIMSDLMNSAFKENELVSNKAIIQVSNKTHVQKKALEKTETKEKATFNLSLNSLEALEDAWIRLKRQFKGEQRITKTAIVEAALEIAINDLKVKDSDSLLHKKFTDKN